MLQHFPKLYGNVCSEKALMKLKLVLCGCKYENPSHGSRSTKQVENKCWQKDCYILTKQIQNKTLGVDFGFGLLQYCPQSSRHDFFFTESRGSDLISSDLCLSELSLWSRWGQFVLLFCAVCIFGPPCHCFWVSRSDSGGRCPLSCCSLLKLEGEAGRHEEELRACWCGCQDVVWGGCRGAPQGVGAKLCF